MRLEEAWHAKSDEEVALAARKLEDYTDEGQRVILAEWERRGLSRALVEDDDAIETRVLAGPPDGMGHVQRLWQGYVSLPVTYWVWGIAGGLAVGVAVAVGSVAGGRVVALPVALLGIAYYVFVTVAIWRSANRYRGKAVWAQLAQVSVAAGAARTVVQLLFGS